MLYEVITEEHREADEVVEVVGRQLGVRDYLAAREGTGFELV